MISFMQEMDLNCLNWTIQPVSYLILDFPEEGDFFEP